MKEKKLPSLKELKKRLIKQVEETKKIQDAMEVMSTHILDFEVKKVYTHKDVEEELQKEKNLGLCISLKLEINKLQKELREFRNTVLSAEAESIERISKKENVSLVEAASLNQEMYLEQIQYFNAQQKSIEENIKLKKAALAKLL